MDVVFINPSVGDNYQALKLKYSAIEPPTWSLLLAQSMRSFGYKVSIIDINAEKISQDQVYDRITKIKPRLIAMVVYGQNVNAGTTNMEGALKLSKFLKNKNKNLIAYFGSHVQAVPREILRKENSVDIVFTNEGVYALKKFIKTKYI